MTSAAVSRLETLLQARQLDRTVTRLRPSTGAGDPVTSTGIAALDAALGGGWRQGEVSEVIGERSSGGLSTMLATLAAATAQGGLVGLVDVLDRFDPRTASAAGVDLDRMLWVRGPASAAERARPAVLDRAVRQGVRALDLLLRAGGFAVAVLDVTDVPPLYLRALPYTTWLRLAHANEGRETVGLIVGRAPAGRSARGATLRLAATGWWAGNSPQSRRLAGLTVQAQLVNARTKGQVRWDAALKTEHHTPRTMHQELGTKHHEPSTRNRHVRLSGR